MNFKEHFKNNKNWWLIILVISYFICGIFPVEYPFLEDKSQLGRILFMWFGLVFWGIVLFLFPYLISILIKRRLNESQIKITLIICFSFLWLLQIINHFGKGLLNSTF